MLRIQHIYVITFLTLLLPHRLNADSLVTVNFYPSLADVKSDSDLTFTAFVPLPARISYFSFANFGGLFHSGRVRFQITEQNLIWQLADDLPFDLVTQDTIRHGHNNDTIHLGLRWRLNNTDALNTFFSAIHLNYSLQLFPLRFDQRDIGGWQISHVYLMTFPYISERLYFSGFLDHNINEKVITGGTRDNIVSENQFGIRLFEKIYAVAEFRLNEYRRSNTSNFGLGIEIKSNW